MNSMRTRLIATVVAATFLPVAFAHASTVSGSIHAAVVIAAPQASPAAGAYTSTQSVTLSAAHATSIRYVTDDSHPSCISGTEYTAPITVDADTTISAVACYGVSEMAFPSDAATFAYTITIPPALEETPQSSAPASTGSGGNGPIAGSLPTDFGSSAGGGAIVPVQQDPAPAGTQQESSADTAPESTPEVSPPSATISPVRPVAITATPTRLARAATPHTASTTLTTTASATSSSRSTTTAQLASAAASGAGNDWLLWVLFILALGYLLRRLYGHYRDWREAR